MHKTGSSAPVSGLGHIRPPTHPDSVAIINPYLVSSQVLFGLRSGWSAPLGKPHLIEKSADWSEAGYLMSPY